MNYHVFMDYTNDVSDWVLAVLIVLCLLAHLACLRSPDVQEMPLKEMGRRIKMAGFGVVAINWWMKLFNGEDITISALSIIGLSFMLFGELMMTLFRLYEHRNEILPERRRGGDRRVDGSVKVTEVSRDS
jgi:hypothetical protein